jgi:hypothetical protein
MQKFSNAKLSNLMLAQNMKKEFLTVALIKQELLVISQR